MSSAPKPRRGRSSPQRLLDYFAVIGLPPSVKCPDGDFTSVDDDGKAKEVPKAGPDVTKVSFVSEVIDRFPRADDDARPFPAGLPLFCMVDGMHLQRGEFAPMPTFFTFRCAGAAGGWEGAVFAACLTFFEPLTTSQLNRLHDLGWHDCTDDKSEGAGRIDKSCEPATAGHANSSLSLFAPKCICILSAFPFLTQLRRLVTEFYRHSLSHMSLPIERYIVNFMLELPAPPRGLLEVRYVLPTAASAESDVGVLTFARPPANQPLSSSPLPFALAFDLLPTAVMLRLMTAVLLDRQVVVHSERLSLLTPTMEVLLSLLFPFRYCHMYLPVLPRGLLGVLQAPTPFFVGMRSRLFEQVCFRPADAGEAGLRMPDDLVVLDLDQGVLLVPDAAPLPALPVKAGRKLQQSLKAALGNVHARRSPMWRQRMLEVADMAFAQSALPEDNEDCDANEPGGPSPLTSARRLSWARVLSEPSPTILPQWGAVRDAALRFFVSCFRDYKTFLVFPTKDVPQPKMLFDAPRFLAATASSDRDFFSRMLDTQAFQQFVDERVFVQAAASGSDVASGKAKAFTADVLFFDESIDAKHNRSLLRMNKRETPFLDSTAYAATKTYVALEPTAAPTPPASCKTDACTVSTPSAGSDDAKHVHVYERFPQLDDELFGEARYIPPFDIPGVDPSGAEVEPALALKTGNAAWRWREGRDAAEKATVNTAEERERTAISLWFGTFCESIALPDARQPLHTLESKGGPDLEGTQAKAQSIARSLLCTPSSADHGEGDGDTEQSPRRKSGAHDLVRSAGDTSGHGRLRRDSAEERQRRMSADLSRNGALAELDLAFEVLETSAVLGFCSESQAPQTLASAPQNSTSKSKATQLQGAAKETATNIDSGESKDNVSLTPVVGKEPLATASDDSKDGGFTTASVVRNANAGASPHICADAAAKIDTQAGLHTASKADADIMVDGSHAGTTADALTSDTGSGRAAGSTEISSFSAMPSPAVYAPIFRALLSACGRCGSVEQALRVLELMSRAHVRPDSAMLCTVVSSFAMDSGGMETPLALKMLDWNALRAQQAENEAFSKRVGRRRSSVRNSSTFAAAGSSSARAGSTATSPTSIQTSSQSEARVSPKLCMQHAITAESVLESENKSLLLPRSFVQSESLLTRKFPELAIDTDRETCPACGTKLTLADVQRGFSTERSDYTTECPATGCGRRFVGRFTVHSRSQRWVGSTGKFTPLFCEFLSPWALAKEVRTVVHDPEIDGIEMLCSAAFSRKSPVIFWNLILYWRQFMLPFGFLLAGAPDEE